MDWLEILLTVPVEQCDTAAAIANMSVPYGIYIEDYSDLEQGALEIAHIDLIDEDLLKKNRQNAVIHIYFGAEDAVSEAAAYLSEQLKAANVDFKLDYSKVLESDWKDKWKQYFKITEIGERLMIRPLWEEMPETERKVITIDPGAAFGTGTHATTSLCLEIIEKYVTDGTVLDIGSGSGILGIGAALLGAKSVTGVDIDPVAVRVAKENAELNGVGQKTEFVEGDLLQNIKGTFDVVCANIVADAIISLAPTVKDYLKKDGIFICSGIIDMRAKEVEDALLAAGYDIFKHSVKDNWHAYAVKLQGVDDASV